MLAATIQALLADRILQEKWRNKRESVDSRRNVRRKISRIDGLMKQMGRGSGLYMRKGCQKFWENQRPEPGVDGFGAVVLNLEGSGVGR